MRTGLSKLAAAAAIALTLAPAARAQDIARRIAAVGNGTAELHFASRPGVCGDGDESVSIGRSMHFGRYDANDAWTCEAGPVRVRLRVEDGAVRDIRTSVGRPREGASGAPGTDLGTVSAPAAAAYFLQLAKTANSHVSNVAITPAILADSVYPWRELLAIARDTETRSQGTRSSAGLWLSRLAGAKLSGRVNDLSDPDDDESVSDESQARSSAVFALSQLRNHEGIPPLLQVAQTNRDVRVRRSALFWLGQSGDARALDLFEKILSSR
jgi:hypothetical protein